MTLKLENSKLNKLKDKKFQRKSDAHEKFNK